MQVIEAEPSVAARAADLATRLTVRPVFTVFSHVPHLPWPWGALEQAARVFLPAATGIRAAVRLPNASALLIRADGVAPADGTRRVILYLHGGAFLGCGAHSHGRLLDLLSRYADAPVLAVNYRLLPKHTVYWHGELGTFGMMRGALALATLHVVFIQWKLHHRYL